MTNALSQRRFLGIQSRMGSRAAAIAGAVLVNWLIRTVGALVGVDFAVLERGETTHIAYDVLAIFTTGIALIGWGILAVLERMTRFAKQIWTSGALLLVALSVIPIVLAPANLPTKICLGIMHVATAAIIVPVMRRTTLRRD